MELDMSYAVDGGVRRFAHVFSAVRPRRVLLNFVTILFVIEAAIGPVYAKDPGPTVKTFRTGFRPANYYRLRFARDPELCDAVLASLNKAYPLPTGLGSHRSRQSSLGNELEVKWTPRSFYYGRGKLATDRLQSVVVDIDNDGENEIVFRFTGIISNRYDDSIYITDLFTSSNSSGDIIDEETLKTKIYAGNAYESKYALELDQRHAPELWRLAYEDVPQGFAIFAGYMGTVISVRGEYYLLAKNHHRPPGGPWSLFVLRYHSPQSHSVVCQFRERHSHP